MDLLGKGLDRLFARYCLASTCLAGLCSCVICFERGRSDLATGGLVRGTRTSLRGSGGDRLLAGRRRHVRGHIISFFRGTSKLGSASKSVKSRSAKSSGAKSNSRLTKNKDTTTRSRIPSSGQGCRFIGTLFRSRARTCRGQASRVSLALRGIFSFVRTTFKSDRRVITFVARLGTGCCDL